jgi:hypothetical protein
VNTGLIVASIAGVTLVACGVLLLVFNKKILRRGTNWQIYSIVQQRNKKIATLGNILVLALFCFLFGLVLSIAGIHALITR